MSQITLAVMQAEIVERVALILSGVANGRMYSAHYFTSMRLAFDAYKNGDEKQMSLMLTQARNFDPELSLSVAAK